MPNPRRPRCHLSHCQTSATHRQMATFPLAVLRPQAHMASSPAALLRYATAEGEQEPLAAEAVSQALPAARSLPLQAQACQPPRVPESEGETQFEQALQSKSVPASQQSAASHAGRGALLSVKINFHQASRNLKQGMRQLWSLVYHWLPKVVVMTNADAPALIRSEFGPIPFLSPNLYTKIDFLSSLLRGPAKQIMG
jgi:hypothetical protein